MTQFFFAEKAMFGRQGQSGETWHCDGVHLWAGPLGLHLFWRLWQSRPDWDPRWREHMSMIEAKK
jgi:hypothetical protein